MSETRRGPRQYACTLQIAAPRRAVWKALTDARELMRWFPLEAEVEARVGGRVVWRWCEVVSWPQVIEVLEPERKLQTRYASGVDDGAGGKVPLFVTFELEGRAGGTTLRLVHSGFGPEADFDTEFDGISRGWPVELRSLRHYLEQHAGQDRTVIRRIVDVSAFAPDEAWARLVGPEALACAPAILGTSEGDAFEFRTRGGAQFHGTTLTQDGREWSGVVTSHERAWMRLCVEDCGGWQAWLWFAGYALDPARTAEIERVFDHAVQAAFGVRS